MSTGVTLRWTSMLSKGSRNTLIVASFFRTRDKLRPDGPFQWLLCTLNLTYVIFSCPTYKDKIERDEQFNCVPYAWFGVFSFRIITADGTEAFHIVLI